MPLTGFAKARIYDWSRAVGGGTAQGAGANYIQSMYLGKNGAVYTANRGSESSFEKHFNKVQICGPGENELLADFFEHSEGDVNLTWPFGIAADSQGRVYVSDEWVNTISVFDSSGKFLRKWGKTGNGDGELLRPAGLAVEKNGNIIVVDSGNNRLQVFTPEGKFVGKCGGAGRGDGEFNQPWGITLDKDGNIYVADWKNHRVQKLSPAGKFLMKFGQYGKVSEPEDAYSVTMVGPYVSTGEPGLLNHPTDVAVDPDGDIYVSDWGNHRVCVFDPGGQPIGSLIGDTRVTQENIAAGRDIKARTVKRLEPEWRFCFPTAVVFNPETDQLIVADSPRDRLQIYKKVRDYSDYQTHFDATRYQVGERASVSSPPVETADPKRDGARPRTPSSPQEQSAATRHINAWIEDGAPPLETGRAYRLGINIGSLRERALASTKVREPQWKRQGTVSLLVVVSGQGFTVEPRQHEIVLMRRGDTEPVYFAVTPTRQNGFLLRISFYLARELALLQEFEIPLEVKDSPKAAA